MPSIVTRLKSFSLEKKIVLGAITIILGSAVVSAAASPANNQRTEDTPGKTQPQMLEKKTPETAKKVITEPADIPFEKTTVNDPNMDKGRTAIKTAGVNGKKTLKYEITYQDGKEVDKKLIGEEVTEQPITEVLAIGTYTPPPVVTQPSNCHSSYSGACVPIASDVDCAGGSGNGPAYVNGPVTVVGADVYDLDRDGDGLGCE